VLRPLAVDEQLGVTDNVEKEDMRDFQLNFLFNLGSHMNSHGNADTMILSSELPRDERKAGAQRNRCRADIKSK
jgi:hypothetical protein